MPSTDMRDALEAGASALRAQAERDELQGYVDAARADRADAEILDALAALSAPEERGHRGDPCIYCGTPHDEVAVGDCPGVAAPEERVDGDDRDRRRGSR